MYPLGTSPSVVYHESARRWVGPSWLTRSAGEGRGQAYPHSCGGEGVVWFFVAFYLLHFHGKAGQPVKSTG